MKVFILKHSINIYHPEEPCPEDRNSPEYIEVVSASNAFADWLMKSVVIFGTAFRGPLISDNKEFEDHYLLCLHCPWPEMHGMLNLNTQPARGEIFVTDDHVFFAEPEKLICFENEILKSWYEDEHGSVIPDLDFDLRRRISRTCRFHLQELGYNGIVIHELKERWIECIYKSQPADWSTSWFEETLKSTIQEFEREFEKQEHWFVYEALQRNTARPLTPPIEGGEGIAEVIEALVDLPGIPRQWLLYAESSISHSTVRNPEFESIRRLEANEVYCSRRGVFWNAGTDGIWLGEIGGEMLQDQHGEIVDNVEERLRDYIIESLASGIEARSKCKDYSRIIEVLHTELDELDIFELWYHDLGELTRRVIEELKDQP